MPENLSFSQNQILGTDYNLSIDNRKKRSHPGPHKPLLLAMNYYWGGRGSV